jgi:hypothetical protein
MAFTLSGAAKRGADVYMLKHPLERVAPAVVDEPRGFTVGAVGAPTAAGQAAVTPPPASATNTLSGSQILQTYIPGTLLALYLPLVPLSTQVGNAAINLILLVLFAVLSGVYVLGTEINEVAARGGGRPRPWAVPKFPPVVTVACFLAYATSLPGTPFAGISGWKPVYGTLVVGGTAAVLWVFGSILEQRF